MIASKSNHLFIIGAPKCGTSTLFYWLSSHPNICGSNPKETFYFLDKNSPLRGKYNFHDDNTTSFSDFFATTNAKYLLDASTHYLYDNKARTSLCNLPNSKFIVLLRDPIRRLCSSFLYTKNNLGRLPSDFSFTQYMDVILNKHISSTQCPFPKSSYVLSNDLAYSTYVNYTSLWSSSLPPESFKILVMEDFFDNPNSCLIDIFQWLGLDCLPSVARSSCPKNKTYSTRFPSIHSLVQKYKALVPIPKPYFSSLSNLYKLLATKPSTKTINDIPSDDEYNYLYKYYSPFNSRLQSFHSLNISSWAYQLNLQN